jgi:hypothetical protein
MHSRLLYIIKPMKLSNHDVTSSGTSLWQRLCASRAAKARTQTRARTRIHTRTQSNAPRVKWDVPFYFPCFHQLDTELCTYHAPWSTVILENPTLAQLVKKLTAFPTGISLAFLISCYKPRPSHPP